MENRLIFSLLAYLCLIALAAANPETEDAVVTEDVTGDASNAENGDFGMPGMGQKMPSPSELLKMLDSMTGMSDEDKESLRQDLLRNIQGQASQQFTQQAGSNFFGQTAMLLGFLSLLALIFVFFGYRLHKLLTEREMKREEKKRLKQMKKKK